MVQVQTVNDIGSSSYSSPAFVYVGYVIPKQKVKGLVAEPLSSSSVSVKWDLSDDILDVISGFKVRYVPVLPVLSSNGVFEEMVVAENTSVVLTELRKFTEYQVHLIS